MLKTCFALCLFAACGSVPFDPPKELPDDAGTDAEVDAGDAGDPVAPPPTPGRAITGAAGRMTGGTWTADVQLGEVHGSRTTGGPFTTITAAPLNP